jgi:hypothetical protein
MKWRVKKNMSTETTALTPAAPQRAVVAIGTRGLQPADMDGLWRTAQAVAKSGLAPKGIDTPEAVFVAMEMGLELGLPLMASLQNIAVVNGRPTLWGDSQLAVVRATGELEEFSEWYEVGGKRIARNPSEFTDATAAVCRVKRRGMEASETAFSVSDAKRAGLWGKAGPWSQYPARMLKFRARSFGLRDQFGDALRGLLSTEEAQDVPVVVTGTDATVGATPRFRKPEAHPLTPAKQEPVAEPVSDIAPGTTPELTEAPATGSRLSAVITTELEAAGVTFSEFQAWAIGEKYKGADTWSCADDIPDAVAARFVKSIAAVIAAVKGGGQ